MLTYLINVTSDLFTVLLVTSTIFAFIDYYCHEKAQLVFRVFVLVGMVAAGIRSYITNTRRLVGGWRIGAFGYAFSLVALVVMFVALIVMFKRLKQKEEDDVCRLQDFVMAITSGLVGASYMYITLPNVYVYPFKFDTGGNGILSSDFLLRLGGYLLGIIVCVLAGLAAYQILMVMAKKDRPKYLMALFIGLNVMFGVFVFAKLMLVLIPRRIIRSLMLFTFAARSNNKAHWYTYAAFIVLLAVSVILWICSRTIKEPYANNAQRRKQKALWRHGKRYTVVLAVCFVMAILCSTWFVKLNTVVIREAPVEDPVIIKNGSGEDESLKVTLDMVNDGHLHRFGYTTSDGIVVRFIVVLKQENTSNYGVGLDACEICGEAGYYENNEGQVVCKKCNVVMNKTTIGMKGGCNPIIIDYDMDASAITVPVAEMIKNASHFKK